MIKSRSQKVHAPPLHDLCCSEWKTIVKFLADKIQSAEIQELEIISPDFVIFKELEKLESY